MERLDYNYTLLFYSHISTIINLLARRGGVRGFEYIDIMR